MTGAAPKKVVITGIAGRLGRVVARALHHDPQFVLEGLDRREFPERPKDVVHHRVDVRSKKARDVFRHGDVAALVRALTEPRPPGTLAAPLGALGPARPVVGALVPGNLTMLAHLIGTPWQLDLGDAVALIEEVDEKPYMIDRDLTQLQLAGLLVEARGVIVGDLTRCSVFFARGARPAAACRRQP